MKTHQIITASLLTILLALLPSMSFAQKINIQGMVGDKYGNPIENVLVTEINANNSVMTSANGMYKISVDKGAMLSFSCKGYLSQIKKVNSALLNVVMELAPNKSPPELKTTIQFVPPVIVREYEVKEEESFSFLSADISSQKITIQQPQRQDGETYTAIEENAFKLVSSDPLSTFSADIDKASYSNVRSYIENGNFPPKDAVRLEEMINYFTYDYDAPTNGEPVKFHTEVGACPWNKDNRLVKIGLKAKEMSKEQAEKLLPRTNLVFLIDVSGSMWGENRLGLVQKSMKLLLDQLRPDDRVAIVTYANRTAVRLESTPVKQKEKIIATIDALNAGGSTSGGAGIRLAYDVAVKNFVKGGNNRVVLCTDGDFNVGISNPDGLKKLIEEKRETGVFLSVFGYGMYNYRDDMMQTLSKAGNGNYAYINNLMEANREMVEQFYGTMYTIAKDVKLQVEFNPERVHSYRLVGYELRVLNNEDFNDDKKDAGDMGLGHTVTAFYEIVPAGKGREGLVDALKYQVSRITGSKELLTVKMRYKDPDGDVSRMVSTSLIDNDTDKVSDDFRFAGAVARYGMILRDSENIKPAELEEIAQIAATAYGKDEDGYRREFVRLVNLTRDIAKTMAKK